MMNTIDYLIESQLMEADMVFNQATMEVSLKDRIGEKLTRNKIVDTIRRWLAKIRKFIMDLIMGLLRKSNPCIVLTPNGLKNINMNLMILLNITT